MKKPRISESAAGIQDPAAAKLYDRLARQLRDLGWNGVREMLSAGLGPGTLLELAPGPGYLGLELARQLGSQSLTGCVVNPAMLRIARKNAAEYGLQADYVLGSAMDLPFPDGSFDCVVSNGSLHEWETPRRVFDEIWRVLRPGGRFCVTDLRRDAAAWKQWLMCLFVRSKPLRTGLRASLAAAYTVPEVAAILRQTHLSEAQVRRTYLGLCAWGIKS